MNLAFRDAASAKASLVIESSRLRLQPLGPDDATDIFSFFTPAVTRFMMPKPAQAIGETQAFIATAQSARIAGTELHWRIGRRDTGEFLGVCGLHGNRDATLPELGIWLKLPAHGHGYGLEAITAIVHWSTTYLSCSGFLYPVDRRNFASRRIPEALGGHIVGTLKVHNLSGDLLDELIYQIPATLAPEKSTRSDDQAAVADGPRARSQRVVVSAYDTRWPAEFEAEARRLNATLGEVAVAIDHIGSTAVPDLVAKPIIDILLAVTGLQQLDDATPGMCELGYAAMGEFGIVGRRFFRKLDDDGQPSHHVHAFAVGTLGYERHLAFRDYLRAHPGVANRYGELKRHLAAQHPGDPSAYTDGKSALVKAIEADALNWRFR